MDEVERPIEYDRFGRMKYHPGYHHNYNKPYTTKELSYICKHYERGQVKSLALALGRTEHSLRMLVNKLKRDGLFEQYKNMVIE